jgi:hypothetical protein
MSNIDLLSSKSENRFLENFHTMKPMTPSTATPPATERPTIEPVPKPPLAPLEDVCGAAEDEVCDASVVPEIVVITKEVEPPASVVGMLVV